MFMLNGIPLSLDVAFTTADGIQRPANWLRLASQEERASIGITEVPDPENYDQRFFWSPNNPKLLDDREEVDQDGKPMWVKVYDPATESMVDTDKRLVTKGLKSQWVSQIKDTAGKMLAQSDWMIIRKAERNIDIPQKTADFRSGVIAECDRLETAIKACASVEDLIDIVSSQQWPIADKI